MTYQRTYGSQKFTVIWIALQALSITISRCEDVRPNKNREGNIFISTNQQRSTAKQKRYETTLPLLLVGEEWRPISLLQSKNHPDSLKVLIEADGEHLLLALEKNHGLFASHYTEQHFLEDGSVVNGSDNCTK